MFKLLSKLADLVFGKPSSLPPPPPVVVETKPEEAKPEEPFPPPPKVPADLAPYRKPALRTTDDGLTWEVKGNEPKGPDHSDEEIEKLRIKTERRARRHFAGKEVRHRVTVKTADSIEFSFFRRSGKPVKIRWQKPEQLPTSSNTP